MASKSALVHGWRQFPIIYDGKITGYRWEWSESYKDGILNDYELNHKDFLGPSDSDLADLSGIEYLTNLKRVFCNNVKVTTANISGFSKLIEFHLSGSNLESINASGCSNLKVLGFSDSPNIKDVNLSGCSALETIYCTNSPPTIEGLASCRNLKYFCGGNNQFTSINFSGLPKLEEICCDSPSLTEVNVNGCTSLRILWMLTEDRKVKKLDLSSCQNLTTLGCINAGLRELDLSQNTKLTELHCENNRLTELDLSNNHLLEISYCGNQQAEGLKVKSVLGGYEVCLKDYVKNVENIDISTIGANNYKIPLLSYDGEKGTVLFAERPVTLHYKYRTHSPSNTLMDVTIKSSMTVDVIERGGPTDNIIYGITDKNYLEASGNALDENSISHLSAKKYGKKGFVADGNSRLIVRVQTQRPGKVTFEVKDIDAGLERLSDRAKTNSFHTYKVGGNSYQVSAVLIAPEMFPVNKIKNFPEDTFTVHVKFTADDTGEDIPEEEKEAEEDIKLEIHAAPVILLHSFGGKASVGNTFSDGINGVLPVLQKKGFKVYPFNYDGTQRISEHLAPGFGYLFNDIVFIFGNDYIKKGIVCTKIDMVGYGMGGLMARQFCLPGQRLFDGNYYTFRSYGQGMVRRIVTIATPHRGTLWANFMLGEWSALRPNAEAGFKRLAYRVLKYAVTHHVVEFFNGMLGGNFAFVDSGVWEDLSVGGNVANGGFPVNVPMYSVYGQVKTIVDNANLIRSTASLAISMLAKAQQTSSILKCISKFKFIKPVDAIEAAKIAQIEKKFEEISNMVADSRIIEQLKLYLKGGTQSDFVALVERFKNSDEIFANLKLEQLKAINKHYAELKNTLLSNAELIDKYINPQNIGKFSSIVDFINTSLSRFGGFSLPSWLTWAAEVASVAVGGLLGLVEVAVLELPFAIIDLVFLNEGDYDLLVSQKSAMTDFGSASQGIGGWRYRHDQICKQNDVGNEVASALKDYSKSLLKIFDANQVIHSVNNVKASNSVLDDNDEDDDDITIDPDKLFETHFELTAEYHQADEAEYVIFNAVADTSINGDVYLAVQQQGRDNIIPMFELDENKYELILEISSSDKGLMNAYCFTEGSGENIYISDTVYFAAQASADITELSFLDNDGIIFMNAGSEITPELYAKTSDGITYDISSPLMGTVWTSSNSSAAIVSDDGLIH